MPPKPRIKRAPAPELENEKVGPPCPRHKVAMTYQVERGAWGCVMKGCRMISWPEADMTGKPVVGKGALQLITQSGRVWLRAENNVMVEITDMIWKSEVIAGTTGAPGVMHVILQATNYLEFT